MYIEVDYRNNLWISYFWYHHLLLIELKEYVKIIYLTFIRYAYNTKCTFNFIYVYIYILHYF